jgi:DNA polymerase
VLALAHKPLAITRHRGPADFAGRSGFITVHPSYLLRLPDVSARDREYERFVADLTEARRLAD